MKDMTHRWLVGVGLWVCACGDSGAGSGTESVSGSSTGSTGAGASTSGEPTTESLPTTGGSQSASGTTSTGPTPEQTGTSTEDIGVTTTTGPGETSTGETSTGETSAGETSTGETSAGETSTGGLECAEPLVECDGSCVDPGADAEHCGGCGISCVEGQVCAAGLCEAVVCAANTLSPCYTGPNGTLDVGACEAGAQQCNEFGTALGPCLGEVGPVAEDCAATADEDCDGKVDDGCFLKNCAEIKQTNPAAGDGEYKIDLDGDDAPIPPFFVKCDMTTQGGGWTRFNWLHTDYTAGQDPLGQTLQECNISDLQCRGRIPAGPVKDLLIKDLTDVTHAMWTFNNSTISNAVLAALQSKVQYCGANQGAFNPVVNTSAELYCGNGSEGGCDSFFYTSGSCNNVGNWGIHWDGDGAWCAAAFKMGATFGGCGSAHDQGFLNECACDDEKGELYYR